MSPEQIRGEAANPNTDVWAVGCLLYECLCGRPLIVGRNVAEKLAVTMTMDVGPALEAARLVADLSARLSLLLKRCLAASAEERPASMHDVRLLLEEEIADRALPRAAEDRPAAPEAQAAPGNLPWSLTSFVGRAHDLAETVRLMDEHRMVTITGAGGCGKTRLSLEIARRKREACPDGAWWVELASLSDSALVPATAAAALNVQQTPGATALDTLLRFLGDRSVLLILDN